MYTIREFAEKFHTTEHTVRYYTDIGLLPCQRGSGRRRLFDEESVNWMQGILCLKGCGATMEEIQEYGALCRQPESEETFRARYEIILRQRKRALARLEEAKATVDYMEEKVRHYEQILAGEIADDSNPAVWTAKSRPAGHGTEKENRESFCKTKKSVI